MSEFSRLSPEILAARDRAFVKHFTGVSMIERLMALDPRPAPPPLSPYEEMMRGLDWQHERVRDAYAVLRGEMAATEE